MAVVVTPNLTLVDEADSTTGWTADGGFASPSAQTTVFREATGAIQGQVSQTAGHIWHTLDAAADLTGQRVYGWVIPYNDREPQSDPLEVLRQGVNAWNLWRKKYSSFRPQFKSANLNGMSLEGVDFREADLSSATLQGCDFYKANFSGATATAAKLQRSDLSRALAVGTNLSLADLSEADLSGADLSGSRLIKCKLVGANLVATNLCGADLSEAIGLTPQQMSYTSTDEMTKLPAYL